MTKEELAAFIRDQLPEVEVQSGYTNFDDGYELDHGIIDGHYNLIALAERILNAMKGR